MYLSTRVVCPYCGKAHNLLPPRSNQLQPPLGKPDDCFNGGPTYFERTF